MKKRIEALWVVKKTTEIQSDKILAADNAVPVLVTYAYSIAEASIQLGKKPSDVILSDWYLEDGKGLELLPVANTLNIPLLLTQEYDDPEKTLKAIRSGAMDCIVRTPDNIKRISIHIYKTLLQWKKIRVTRNAALELAELNKTLSTQNDNYIRIKEQMLHANVALQASEQKLRAIFDAATNISFIIGEADSDDPRVIDCSPGTEAIFGYSRLELIGRNISLLHLPGHDSGLREINEKLRNNTTGFKGETTLVRKSGEQFPALLTTFPICDSSGKVICGLGVTIDITDRKKMEDTLRESETLLRTLINAMPDIVCFKDAEGRWIEANQSHLKLFHMESDTYKGLKDSDLTQHKPEFRETLLYCEETDRLTWEKGTLTRYEESFPSDSGMMRQFDIIKVPTYNTSGEKNGIIIVGRDITERKLIEDQMFRTKNELEAILQGIADGIVVIDKDNVSYCNHTALEMIGYKNIEELKQEIKKYQVPIHLEVYDENGETFDQWESIFHRVWQGQTTEPITIQYTRRDSEQRYWSTFRASPVLDTNRIVRYVVCIFHDITESRHAGEELRKLSMAVEQSPAMVIITDVKGNIEYTNPKFTEITGYTSQEVLGQNPRILKSGKMPDSGYKSLWDEILSGREWHGEFITVTKTAPICGNRH